ncbi:uncharacterized [Tachysurus ichikawai]
MYRGSRTASLLPCASWLCNYPWLTLTYSSLYRNAPSLLPLEDLKASSAAWSSEAHKQQLSFLSALRHFAGAETTILRLKNGLGEKPRT